MIFVLVFLLSLCLCGNVIGEEMVVLPGGTFLFSGAGEVTMTPGCQSHPNFDSGTGGGPDKVDSNGLFRFKQRTRSGHEKCPVLDFASKIGQTERGLSFDVSVLSDSDVNLAWAGISFSFPTDYFRGGRFVADGESCPFPLEPARDPLRTGSVRQLAFYDKDGQFRFGLQFPDPTIIHFQDGRRWNGMSYTLRVIFKREIRYAQNERNELNFEVWTKGTTELKTGSGHVCIRANEDWLPVAPMPEIRPGSALDFSSWTHSGEAGRFGRVVVRNGRFEFAELPGRVQRFWGVNVNSTGCVMDAVESQKFAAYLAKIGYNSVRIHHHDRLISRAGTPLLDDGQMMKLDAFAAACKAQGIYLTTDLYVSRVRKGMIPYRSLGLDLDGTISESEYKDLIPFHDGVKSNYLAFARNFLNHVNPYTGMSWGHEPALAFVSLVNEGTLGNFGMTNFRKFSSIILPHWRRWLTEKKSDDPRTYGQIPDTLPTENLESACTGNRHAAAFNLFLADVECGFVSEVRRMLDELGCHALITDINAWYNPITAQRLRADLYDYVDEHHYVDHPVKIAGYSTVPPSYCANANPVEGDNRGGYPLAPHRIMGKPYTISEWNYCAPGKFRSVGPLLMSAFAALQDYSAAWRFTWSHGFSRNDERSRLGYFDVSTDPIQLASERIAFALFLRGDLSPLKDSVGLEIGRRYVTTPETTLPLPRIDGSGWLGWHYRIGSYFPDTKRQAGADKTVAYPLWAQKPVSDWMMQEAIPPAGAGAITVDQGRGVFAVATSRSEAVFARAIRMAADRLTVAIDDVPSTLSVISLDGKSFAKTRRILFSHLTDVQNAETEFADSGFRYQLTYGRLPHLMRVGRADVAMRLPRRTWKVFMLEQDGTRRGLVDSRYVDGRLEFTSDIARDRKNGAVFLYEISADQDIRSDK